MLFLLTGEVQTGKTRWLEGLLSELSERGVPSYGVIAPGVWRCCKKTERDEASSGLAADCCYEKLGIDNVLLPGQERLAFACRRDLALVRDGCPQSQSAQARLAWEISDDALARVNAHFDRIARGELICEGSPGLLVVDELGRLELERGWGLTSALSMLERGPRDGFPHALVVVRAGLREKVQQRWSAVWQGVEVIEPGEAGRRSIYDAFGLE